MKISLFWNMAIEVVGTSNKGTTLHLRLRPWALPFLAWGAVEVWWQRPIAFLWAAWWFWLPELEGPPSV